MQETAGEYTMKINAKKTNVMKFSKRAGLEEFTIFLERVSIKSRIAPSLPWERHRMDPVKKIENYIENSP